MRLRLHLSLHLNFPPPRSSLPRPANFAPLVIFFYLGQEKSGRQSVFAQYKNELEYEGRPIQSNKRLPVKNQNIQQPRLDELFEQLEQVFQPFKNPTR